MRRLFDNFLFWLTYHLWEQHPEWWHDRPCACKECCSYGDWEPMP